MEIYKLKLTNSSRWVILFSDITDINVDSMQCLAKNLSTKDIDYSLDKTEVNQIAITTAKVRRLPYPVSIF